MIPWAQYESAVALCWSPEGEDPDRWPVVAYNEQQVHEAVPGSMVGALVHVLRAEAGRSVFPDAFYEEPGAGDPFRFVSYEDSPLVELPPVDPLP